MMNKNDSIKLLYALSLFEELKNGGSALLNDINSIKQFKAYNITKAELENCTDEFKNFIIKNDLLAPDYKDFGMPKVIEEFYYAYTRLNNHLTTTSLSLQELHNIIESNPDVITDLDLPKDLIGWDIFELNLFQSQNEIIYEHSLITLLSIFEGFINDALKFIYHQDKRLQRRLKISMEYGQLEDSLEKLLELLISENVDKLATWPQKLRTFSKAPIGIELEDKKETKTLWLAITIRNSLIHNKGKIDERVIQQWTELKKHKGSRIPLDYKLYNQISEAIENLVVYIDSKVKSKYG